MKRILFIILLFFVISCKSMDMSREVRKGEISFTFPEMINQWRLVNTIPAKYDAENLYDYIDGNAEVYRSLGVKEVLAYRWTHPEQPEIIVDIFDMGDSTGAYGAYHNDIRDQKDIGIGKESEYMNNSLAFWKSKYFASITGMGDSPELNQTVVELAKIIDNQIPEKGEIPQIVHLLPEEGLMKTSIHYFKDFNLLNVHYFIANENILGIDSTCEGVLVRYSIPERKEQFNVIIIKYPKKNLAHEHAQKLSNSLNQIKESSEQGDKSVIFSFKSISIYPEQQYLILITDWQRKEIADIYAQQILQKIKR